jgi:Predicted Rossmann fold nucleotide-binding protein involved in DNA uptake
MKRKIEHLRPPSKGNTKRSNARPCFGVRFYALVFKRSFFVLVMVSLASFVCSFPCVAFSGSRLSGSSAAASCRAFLPLLSGFGGSVGVGCASGVDSVVRSAFPSASVFRVSSFAVGGRVSRASFALRSSALVSWCASSGGLLVAFPLGACPSGVAVSASFRGCGSGSWGSVALALGLGCSVLVVSPPVGGVGAAWFGALASCFRPVGSAPCGGSLWLACPPFGVASPAPVQLALF